jgi:hypothetical protein
MAKNIVEADAARIRDIASAIHARCHALHEPANEMEEHQNAVKDLSAGMGVTRIGVATEIAALADAEGWTPGELKGACDRAAKMGNADDRGTATVKVFISEMKSFASPKVRGKLPTIIEACQRAWQDEADLLAECETKEERAAVAAPVHKYKSRIYHLVLAIARAVKGDELDVADESDVIAWAIEHDPDHDEDKVAARLKVQIDKLTAIYDDFGLDEIKTAAEYLGTVTAKELLAARKVKLASEAASDAKRMAAHRLASVSTPVVTSVVSTPVSTPAPETIAAMIEARETASASVSVAPAEGVFDILNDDEGEDEITAANDDEDEDEDEDASVTNDPSPVRLVASA